MDDAGIVSRLALLLRVRPELQQICRFGAQWSSRHGPEPSGWAPFHIVTRGACVIEAGERRVLLSAGDVAVLPHGGPHTVRATPGDAPHRAASVRSRRDDGIVVKANVDGEPDTTLICGRLRFEQAQGNLVLAALPPLVVLAACVDRDAATARQLVELIRSELDADRLGAASIAGAFANALIVLVLRTCLEAGREEHGILALLGQRQTARTLAAILRDPARAWTLDTLAAEAATSRATLVRLFRAAVDRAPLGYLGDLRLLLARGRLYASDEPIAAIAADVGYGSETAFHRAYARHFSIAPGADRKRHAGRREAEPDRASPP